MARPKRTDLYRPITFHCTDSADRKISYIQGNAPDFGLPMCSTRSDAIVLCVEQVFHLMKIEKETGVKIPWEKD